MISFKLSDVPTKKPHKPIIQKKIFLKIMNAFSRPEVRSHLKIVSNNGGKMMPNALRANAPINEMNKSRFGIATAMTTKKWILGIDFGKLTGNLTKNK